VRQSAARAIGQLGPAGRPAVPDLTRSLTGADGSPEVRREAAGALGSIGQAAGGGPDVLAPLVAGLRDPSPEVRGRAAAGVGYLGRAARSAVPDLVRLLQQDADLGVRMHAAGALGDLGAAAREALPALRTVADGDANADLRKIAAESVVRITRPR
jgi:HEAT repeat protein